MRCTLKLALVGALLTLCGTGCQVARTPKYTKGTTPVTAIAPSHTINYPWGTADRASGKDRIPNKDRIR